MRFLFTSLPKPIHSSTSISVSKNYERFPLHEAIKKKRSTHTIKYLIEDKAIDINEKNDEGRTPLEIAFQKNRIKVIQLLVIEADFDVISVFLQSENSIWMHQFYRKLLFANREYEEIWKIVLENILERIHASKGNKDTVYQFLSQKFEGKSFLEKILEEKNSQTVKNILKAFLSKQHHRAFLISLIEKKCWLSIQKFLKYKQYLLIENPLRCLDVTLDQSAPFGSIKQVALLVYKNETEDLTPEQRNSLLYRMFSKMAASQDIAFINDLKANINQLLKEGANINASYRVKKETETSRASHSLLSLLDVAIKHESQDSVRFLFYSGIRVDKEETLLAAIQILSKSDIDCTDLVNEMILQKSWKIALALLDQDVALSSKQTRENILEQAVADNVSLEQLCDLAKPFTFLNTHKDQTPHYKTVLISCLRRAQRDKEADTLSSQLLDKETNVVADTQNEKYTVPFDANSISCTANFATLTDAISINHWDKVNILLKSTPGLAAQCNQKKSPLLHQYIEKCDILDVEYLNTLLKTGIDPNIQSSKQETVFQTVINKCWRKNQNIVFYDSLFSCFIAQGADINAHNGSGYTLLHTLVKKTNTVNPLIKCLIGLGADINLADQNEDFSPLHTVFYNFSLRLENYAFLDKIDASVTLENLKQYGVQWYIDQANKEKYIASFLYNVLNIKPDINLKEIENIGGLEKTKNLRRDYFIASNPQSTRISFNPYTIGDQMIQFLLQQAENPITMDNIRFTESKKIDQTPTAVMDRQQAATPPTKNMAVTLESFNSSFSELENCYDILNPSCYKEEQKSITELLEQYSKACTKINDIHSLLKQSQHVTVGEVVKHLDQQDAHVHRKEQFEKIRFLLDNGANLNQIPNSKNLTLVEEIVKQKNWDLFDLFLQQEQLAIGNLSNAYFALKTILEDSHNDEENHLKRIEQLTDRFIKVKISVNPKGEAPTTFLDETLKNKRYLKFTALVLKQIRKQNNLELSNVNALTLLTYVSKGLATHNNTLLELKEHYENFYSESFKVERFIDTCASIFFTNDRASNNKMKRFYLEHADHRDCLVSIYLTLAQNIRCIDIDIIDVFLDNGYEINTKVPFKNSTILDLLLKDKNSKEIDWSFIQQLLDRGAKYYDTSDLEYFYLVSHMPQSINDQHKITLSEIIEKYSRQYLMYVLLAVTINNVQYPELLAQILNHLPVGKPHLLYHSIDIVAHQPTMPESEKNALYLGITKLYLKQVFPTEYEKDHLVLLDTYPPFKNPTALDLLLNVTKTKDKDYWHFVKHLVQAKVKITQSQSVLSHYVMDHIQKCGTMACLDCDFLALFLEHEVNSILKKTLLDTLINSTLCTEAIWTTIKILIKNNATINQQVSFEKLFSMGLQKSEFDMVNYLLTQYYSTCLSKKFKFNQPKLLQVALKFLNKKSFNHQNIWSIIEVLLINKQKNKVPVKYGNFPTILTQALHAKQWKVASYLLLKNKNIVIEKEEFEVFLNNAVNGRQWRVLRLLLWHVVENLAFVEPIFSEHTTLCNLICQEKQWDIFVLVMEIGVPYDMKHVEQAMKYGSDVIKEKIQKIFETCSFDQSPNIGSSNKAAILDTPPPAYYNNTFFEPPPPMKDTDEQKLFSLKKNVLARSNC